MDQRLYASLKEEYQKSIPGKLDHIAQLIHKIKQNGDKQSLIALRFDIHKMAGSAGMYGYTTVSELCKQEEEYIMEHLDSQPLNPIFFARLDRFLERMKHEFKNKS